MEKPTGTVTFLFTDIEGSTKLAQEFPDTLSTALEKHHKILRNAIESNNGFVFEIIGDAFCSAFEKAEYAIMAAIDIQINLSNENWDDAVIKIRIGIHSGKAEWSGKEYLGYITIARTTRVMSAGYGGQILISESVYKQVDPETVKKFSVRDLGNRRLKDLTEPMNLFQISAPGLQAEFPPLKTLDTRPNNLPIQLTNFIGRENEIREIKDRLAGSKLLTLIGAGGTGKTRLSLQVAADLIDEFSGGVWITELAPLNDPQLIPITLTEVFGINEQPNQDIETTIAEYLIDKEILIILDNCEHLIKDCAHFAENLLKKCPKLKIIATSREALKIAGEHIYRVISMAHPEPEEKYSPEQLSQFEAVRLFIERALSVNPDFKVTNQNAPALAQICYRLDGIPLAIELAAVRIKVLSVEKICDKLQDRFRLLTGGKRTALPRQQTLRSLIDWSYDLLSENEKVLLQRLTVFSGGWTLEQAEEICSDSEIEGIEVMDILALLQDKSLINSKDVRGSFRFDMLETIKQYSKEKLSHQEELTLRFINYFGKQIEVIRDFDSGTKHINFIRSLENDLNNIRSAIELAVIYDQNRAYKIVNELTEFWTYKGSFTEAMQTCEKLLKLDLDVEGINKAGVLYTAGNFSNYIGNIAEAEVYINDSLSLYRELNFKYGIANCLSALSVILRTNPEMKNTGKKYSEEALSLFREIGSKRDIAISLYNASFVALEDGDQELALKYKFEALSIYKELNDPHEIALCLANLSVYELRRFDFEMAKSYAEESLSISNEYGDRYLISINLLNLGSILFEQGENEKALKLFEEAQEIFEKNSYKSNSIVAFKYLGNVSAKMGNNEKALEYYKESIRICKETGNYYFVATALYGIAISFFELSKYESSLRYFLYLNTLTNKTFDPIGNDNLAKAKEYVSKIRELLGDEIFESIEAEANTLDRNGIMEIALL